MERIPGMKSGWPSVSGGDLFPDYPWILKPRLLRSGIARGVAKHHVWQGSSLQGVPFPGVASCMPPFCFGNDPKLGTGCLDAAVRLPAKPTALQVF